MPSSALLSVLYLARNGCENVDEQQAHHKYEDKSEIILKKGGKGGRKKNEKERRVKLREGKLVSVWSFCVSEKTYRDARRTNLQWFCNISYKL